MSDSDKLSDSEYQRRLDLLKQHKEEEEEKFRRKIRNKLSVKGQIISLLGGEALDNIQDDYDKS